MATPFTIGTPPTPRRFNLTGQPNVGSSPEQSAKLTDKQSSIRPRGASIFLRNASSLDVEGYDIRSKVDEGLSYTDALSLLLQVNIGCGIFAMGEAFKDGGLIVSSILSFLVTIICLHNQRKLLECADWLSYKYGYQGDPDYWDTVEMSILSGPKILRGSARTFKIICQVFLFVSQLGLCAFSPLFIAVNIKQVFDFDHYVLGIKVHLLFLIVPIVLVCLLNTLKNLVPCCDIANMCMGSTLVVVYFYAFQNMYSVPMSQLHYTGSFKEISVFFATDMFAYEGIAMIIPLKNAMKVKEDFNRPLGVLNVGMTVVSILYFLTGLIGYLGWGNFVQGSLTYNLKQKLLLCLAAKMFLAISILLTIPLQLYIPVKLVLPTLRSWFRNINPQLVESVLRVFLVLLAFCFAMLVPDLAIFIEFIGSICSTSLMMVFPPLVQLVTHRASDGLFSLVLNGLSLSLGIIATVFGTFISTIAVIDHFKYYYN